MTEEKIDWQDFKCRCSSIHAILSNSKSNPCLTDKQSVLLSELEKKEKLTPNQQEEMARLLVLKENSTKVILSDSCITYLMEEYAWRTQGMVRVTKELMDVPQMQKGTLVEPESLEVLSFVDNIQYKPNLDENGQRERVYNDFLSGEIDAYKGESIMTANKVLDVKSIWDYPTFLCKIYEPLTNANDWQLKGYGDITGASEVEVSNVLINTPEHIVAGQKWKLLNKLNVATEEALEFKEKWAILERSMFFDSIPKRQRVFKKKVELMTDMERQRLYDKVKICREWLFTFDEMYQNINK